MDGMTLIVFGIFIVSALGMLFLGWLERRRRRRRIEAQAELDRDWKDRRDRRILGGVDVMTDPSKERDG
jgi:hypothetical protein